jgi:hypothetical protein
MREVHASVSTLVRARLAGGPWLQLLRWLIVLALVVGIAAWFDLTPRHAGAADFAHDLRAGKVNSYQVGSTFETRHLTPLSVFENSDSGSSASSVLWSTGPFHRYSFTLDSVLGADRTRSAPDVEARRFVAANIGGQRVPTLEPLGNSWSERIAAPVTAAAYLALLVVLGRGPQPRRATKWSLFFIYGIPAGLGAFWALLREAPWSREAMSRPEPPPGPIPGRWTGGRTLIVVALSYTLVLALASSPLTAHPGGSNGEFQLDMGQGVGASR